MKYRKPQYYDAFRCIADRCPDTCCQRWQIGIDEDSLYRYWKVDGAFGNRLKNSINWESGTFCQYDGRCEFLNEKNLCDIYENLGQEYLCDTCRQYPRHVEEFEGVREYSLSLSCPEAARQMLLEREPMHLVEWETPEEETFEEGFDRLLYGRLLKARDVILAVAQDSELDIRVRMEICLIFAEGLQSRLDREAYDELDVWIRERQTDCRRDMAQAVRRRKEKDADRWNRRQREAACLRRLETVESTWNVLLEETLQTLYRQGKTWYEACCAEFEADIRAESTDAGNWESASEKIAVFFIYTYFCGGVYDKAVDVKIRMVVFCLEWIQELAMARWLQRGKKRIFQDLVSTAYRFARQVEHSDANRDEVEEWLMWEEGE